MDRRAFLQSTGAGFIIGLSGCSATGRDSEDRGTHSHIQSSSVWNGVSEEVRQTVFVSDAVVKDGRIDILATIDLDLPEGVEYRPTEATVSLAVDTIADEWTKPWLDKQLLSGTLSAPIESEETVSITSETTFESGGSVQTTRYEEVQ